MHRIHVDLFRGRGRLARGCAIVQLPPFVIHRPETVEQALDVLAAYGDEASVYMGGTELLMIMKLGLAGFSHLVDCKHIVDWNRLDVVGSELSIGAAVVHRDVELSPSVAEALPALAELERDIANVRVRNVGTLCGNLCFAEPHSDPATLLMALGGTVELVSKQGRRLMSLEEFILGPLQTALDPGELMTRAIVPLPERGATFAYERIAFGERPTANVAAYRSGKTVRIVVGAVGPRPVRAREAEEILARGGRDAVSRAADAAAREADPRADLHGSAEFKAHLAKVLVKRAAERLFDD